MTKPERRAPRRKKNWELANAGYAAELVKFVESLGAEKTVGRMYPYKLRTRAGDLWISVRPNIAGAGASVFTRFEDVEAAKTLGVLHLNPYSGKWNHHFFFDVTLEDARRYLRVDFGRVLE
jgi:hypothetical protein